MKLVRLLSTQSNEVARGEHIVARDSIIVASITPVAEGKREIITASGLLLAASSESLIMDVISHKVDLLFFHFSSSTFSYGMFKNGCVRY